MAEAVYILCALTSITCAVLLIRSYRCTRVRLLFWTSLCFVGFALNNVLLCFDVITPTIDLGLWRSGIALCGLIALLAGLIGESS